MTDNRDSQHLPPSGDTSMPERLDEEARRKGVIAHLMVQKIAKNQVLGSTMGADREVLRYQLGEMSKLG